jgi:hypothetical protein
LDLKRDIFKCNHAREPKGSMIEVNDRVRMSRHVA